MTSFAVTGLNIGGVELTGASGGTLVGYGTTTAQDILNAVTLPDYPSLRAYTGLSKTVRITGYSGTAAPSGIAGDFTVDTTDTTRGAVFTGSIAPVTSPAAPILSATAGGTIAATTYFVKITYVTAAGETLPSTEASLAVAVNNVLNVASPAAQTGVTGYNVYVSTATGTETKQNASPIAIGTAWVEPTTGLIAGAAVPTANTSGSVLTVSTVTNGTLSAYLTVNGSGVSAGTYVISLIGGTGGAGTYLVNLSQTVASGSMTADNGGTIIIDALGRRWKRQYTNTLLNVNWFGFSTANTAAQNMTALQAALVASDVVGIGSGTFSITGPIDVTGKTIIGAGIYRTVLQVPGTNTQTTVFYNNQTSAAAWGTGGNLELREFSLRGNWDGATGLADNTWDNIAALVKLGAAAGVRMVDLAIQQSYGHGISFYRLGYATFTRLKVNTSKKNGMHFEAPSGTDAITSTRIQNCDLNSNRGLGNIYVKNGVGFYVNGTVFEDASAGIYLDGTDNRNVTITNNHCETNKNGLLQYVGSGTKTVLANNFGDADFVRTNPAFQTLHSVNNTGMTNTVEEGFGAFGQDFEFGGGSALNNNRKIGFFGTANFGDVVGRLSWRSNNSNNATVPCAEIRSVAAGTVNQNFGALEFGTGNSGLVYRLRLNENGNFYPLVDNAYTCGATGVRWASVWAANGAIQTSDIRTKTDVAEISLGLNFINKLRPVSYKYKIGQNKVDAVQIGIDEKGAPIYEQRVTPIAGKRNHFGLIAQEVKAVIPAGVDFGGWILQNTDDPNSEQALRYDQFISPLIKAVQELSAEVEKLKANQK